MQVGGRSECRFPGPEQPLSAIVASQLLGRALDVAVRAVDAAVAWFGPNYGPATLAVIEELAGIGRHHILGTIPALRTGRGRHRLEIDLAHEFGFRGQDLLLYLEQGHGSNGAAALPGLNVRTSMVRRPTGIQPGDDGGALRADHRTCRSWFSPRARVIGFGTPFPGQWARATSPYQ